MYKYSYRAVDGNGKIVKGTLTAEDNNMFLAQLRAQNLRCYDYKILNKQKEAKVKKLKIDRLIEFSTQLSSMLTAGLPLAMSLEMLYERTESKKKDLKAVLANLLEQVRKGESLASAMQNMGETFPQLYISMVKSGEMSGKIDDTLTNLAEHYSKEKRQKNKIKKATNYPKMLGVIIVLVVGILLVVVMPKMAEMLPEGQELPLPTMILMKIKDFIVGNFALILIVGLGVYIALRVIKKIPKVQIFLGSIKTKIPKLGTLHKQLYTASFARSLATLYQSGVPLLDSMQMSGEVMDNKYIEMRVNEAVTNIRKGSNISEALSNIDSFDPLLTTMIFVGEQSGSLEDILLQTANYFDEEANTATDRLTEMINPIMMCVMAVIVGFVLIAVMMPMFSVYESAGGGVV